MGQCSCVGHIRHGPCLYHRFRLFLLLLPFHLLFPFLLHLARLFPSLLFHPIHPFDHLNDTFVLPADWEEGEAEVVAVVEMEHY